MRPNPCITIIATRHAPDISCQQLGCNTATADCIANAARVAISVGHPTSMWMYFLESMARTTKTRAWLTAEATHAPLIPNTGISAGVSAMQEAAPTIVVFIM